VRGLQLSPEPHVTPWLIKQYYYCPVIPWIIVNYGLTEPPTESMKQGAKLDREIVISKLGYKGRTLCEVEVKSKKLPLRGKVDLVLEEGKGKYVIVEVKAFKDKRLLRHKMQLLTYTLLVEENLGSVRKAILLHGERKVEYQVTGEDLEQAVKAVNKLRRVIESENPPVITPNQRKCKSCWYRRYCPYT